MKKTIVTLFLITPIILFSQIQKTGNLTIFSEDGDKFYLMLNGEKQNNLPQTNLRVEELANPHYNAKIVFADSTLAIITKNNLALVDMDEKLMDVTYKLKKDKAGKPKLTFYSAIEVQKDYIPSNGVHVYRYGRPAFEQVSNGTVLTTVTTTLNDAFSANINMNGIGVNFSVSDPSITTTTTTTTTTTNGGYNSGTGNTNNSPVIIGCKGLPMKPADFNAALQTIADINFDDTKLTTAQSIVSSNCLSTSQVINICRLFTFESSKLAFAKHAYQYTTDRNMYFKVNDIFNMSSSKEELSKFITTQ